MLKSLGKPTLFLKLRSRICVCMRNSLMSDQLRDRIRPKVFAGYACWCDKDAYQLPA